MTPHPVLPPVPDFGRDDPEDDEIKLEVPGFRQLDGYSCGAIAGWSILKTFKPQANFKKFYADCNVDEDGTNEIQITAALRKNGIGVGRKDEMTFDEIVETIDDGKPIIASIHPRGYDPHFLCIYGVGIRPMRLWTCNNTVGWSLHGREVYPWRKWMGMWDKTSRYLICWGK